MYELSYELCCKLILIDLHNDSFNNNNSGSQNPGGGGGVLGLYQLLREKFNQQRKRYFKWIEAKVKYLEQRRRAITKTDYLRAPDRFLPIEFIFDDYLVIDAMKSYDCTYFNLVERLPFVLNRKSLFEMAFKQWFFDPIKQSSQQARMDLDIAYMLVQFNGSELKDLSYQCSANKKVVLAAVSNFGQAYMYACEELKNDLDVIMAAVKNTYIPLEEQLFERYPQVAVEYLVLYADDELNSIPNFVFECKEIILEAISRNVNIYSNPKLSDELKRDRNVILAVTPQNITLIENVKDLDFFKEKEFCLELVKNNCLALKYLSDELSNDCEIMMMCLQQDPSMLELSPKLQRNKEFLLQALKEGFKILPYIPSDLVDDDLFQEFKDKKEIVHIEAETSQHGDDFHMFMDFDEEETIIKEITTQKPDRKLVFQQNDRRAILQAIKQDHSLLDLAPAELTNDREFAIECIVHCSFDCFYYFPILRSNDCQSSQDFMVNNEEILIYALQVNQHDFDCFKIPSNLIENKEFMLKAIEATPHIFLQFAYKLNADPDYCKAMLRYHGYMHFDFIQTRKDFDVMLEERMNYAYGGFIDLH